jgi:hypothetical protein
MRAHGVRGHGVRGHDMRGHGVRGHEMRGHGVRGHDLRGHGALPAKTQHKSIFYALTFGSSGWSEPK